VKTRELKGCCKVWVGVSKSCGANSLFDSCSRGPWQVGTQGRPWPGCMQLGIQIKSVCWWCLRSGPGCPLVFDRACYDKCRLVRAHCARSYGRIWLPSVFAVVALVGIVKSYRCCAEPCLFCTYIRTFSGLLRCAGPVPAPSACFVLLSFMMRLWTAGARAESVLEPVPGLMDFLKWVDSKGLKKAAVTNAPRENARVMLEALGLGCASHALRFPRHQIQGVWLHSVSLSNDGRVMPETLGVGATALVFRARKCQKCPQNCPSLGVCRVGRTVSENGCGLLSADPMPSWQQTPPCCFRCRRVATHSRCHLAILKGFDMSLMQVLL
jgi:hypothetical protein